MAKLSSVLKNVPIDMMWKLRKYHTPNSVHEIRWRARQPIKGKSADWCGNLKWEDAQSADLYAYDREKSKRYSEHWSELYDEHELLKKQLAPLEHRVEYYRRRDAKWRPVIEGIEALIDLIQEDKENK